MFSNKEHEQFCYPDHYYFVKKIRQLGAFILSHIMCHFFDCMPLFFYRFIRSFSLVYFHPAYYLARHFRMHLNCLFSFAEASAYEMLKTDEGDAAIDVLVQAYL